MISTSSRITIYDECVYCTCFDALPDKLKLSRSISTNSSSFLFALLSERAN